MEGMFQSPDWHSFVHLESSPKFIGVRKSTREIVVRKFVDKNVKDGSVTVQCDQ
jgi:hypothetical protein